ncbi:MAG: hypothetical protein Q7K43_05110 [Candidatus Woesearchaeota archaeon]|nr:hypothetical protein [Candidatus Woesearchaeota archaeon]
MKKALILVILAVFLLGCVSGPPKESVGSSTDTVVTDTPAVTEPPKDVVNPDVKTIGESAAPTSTSGISTSDLDKLETSLNDLEESTKESDSGLDDPALTETVTE